jgi:hypothetical protein
VVVRPGHGDGTFGDPIRTGIAPTPGAPLLAVADFNGDGSLDVFTDAFFDFESPPVANVLLGQGDGHFVLWETLNLGVSPRMIGTGDFFGTGRTDVAILGTYFDDQLGYDQSGFEMLVNDGDWGGYFSPPPPIMPNLSINDMAVTERNTGTVAATFTVTLSAASSEAVTVYYATANGTATAGSDYQAASGTLTIPAGQTSGTITVQVNGDRLAEPNETFLVNLSNANYGVLSDNQGAGTIVDDEPRISISDVTKAEGKKNQTTQFSFTVTLSAAYDQPVTMSFRAVDGTAKTSDQDYVAQTGTLTFKPGETTKTITIVVNADSKREADETFYLDLSGLSSNSLFTKSRGTGTILNDD